MKPSNTPRRLALVAGLMSAGMLSQGFAAITTAAGTTVSNTASITGYTVGGVQQLTGGSTIDSNASDFVVDRKIDVVVAQSGSPVTVLAGAPARVLTFTVTNTSNAPLDFNLSAADAANGATVPGGTDSDDVDGGTYTIYADTDGDGLFDPLVDTSVITSLSNIPAESVTVGAHIRTVFVVANIKTTSLNGAYIGASLTAAAREVGGGALTETAGADDAAVVDTVFADAAGAIDAARNAAHSAYASYVIQTATLAVNKTSRVVWDPFNGTTNPKAIPGAVVEYCLEVVNSGAVAASSVVLSDAIPTNTAYYSAQPVSPAGAPTPGVTTGTGAVCGVTPDGVSLGSYAANTVTVNYGSVAAPVLPATSNSVWSRFYVTVQ